MLRVKEHPYIPELWVGDNGEVLFPSDGTLQTYATSLDRYGYERLNVTRKGKSYSCRVHRLVLETWNPTDDPDLEVNHIDWVKTNNALSNLQWTTKARNLQHKRAYYDISEETKSKVVRLYRLGKLWREISEQCGISVHYCKKILMGVVDELLEQKFGPVKKFE